MRLSIKRLLLLISSTLFLFSCRKENIIKGVKDLISPEKANTYKGPQVTVGNGLARTFVTISDKGAPQETGVIFTDEALSGLPAQGTLYVLESHRKAIEATPFTHVVIGLSPQGHPLFPTGSIGPHFDVRFYMTTPAERLAIPAPPATGFDVAPPPGYLPANYVMNAPIAQLGRHWNQSITTDTTLTHTMVYGTWNGEVTFLTPNATLAAMQSGAKISVAYPQPQFFAQHGYYPTRYNIYEDDKGSHYVTLSHFVWR